MGHVTILVQHAWQIRSSRRQKNGNPVSYNFDKNIANIGRSSSPQYLSPLYPKPLASYVRVTVPSSIAQLVKYYNSADTLEKKSECEAACMDILDRLQHIILASNIPDNVRVDKMRQQLGGGKDGYSYKTKLNPKQKPKQAEKAANIEQVERVRSYSSESRISVVMLARCRSQTIRTQSMLLLCEALDTNALSTCDHEIMHLQMLWVELVQMMRHVIDARKRKLALGDTKHTLNESGILIDKDGQLASNEPDTNIMVDVYLEHLLTCLNLTLQRLEHAQDVGKVIQPSPLMEESYLCLLEDLELLKTDDPFVIHLISEIVLQVEDLQSLIVLQGKSRKEMALDVGVSVLSQVIRMNSPGPNIKMQHQFSNILQGLADVNQWHLGRKLLRLIATSACIDVETYILANQGLDWLIRSAAVMVLSEVYQQYRTQPHGLLARENINTRLKSEKHSIVLQLLNSPKAKTPQTNFMKRIQFLFKYTSTSFAEIYAEIQSDYQYMRKYIQTAEKDEKRQRNKRARAKRGLRNTLLLNSKPLIEAYKNTEAPFSKKDAVDSKYLAGPTPEPAKLSTRTKNINFVNLSNIQLATGGDYHKNYKSVVLEPRVPNENSSAGDKQEFLELFDMPDKRVPLPPLTTSLLTKHHTSPVKISNTHEYGTANRRKMFNAEKPAVADPKEELKAHKATIKMPQVPQFLIGSQ
ncbi:hypothetical protein HDV01_000286 [Terramyces sp. JEL0728]|nr:hypothetical protein HDV01_000286 [Terramyces sp. JEL0728]